MTNDTKKDDREAWENYWIDGRNSGSIGCLPDSSGDLLRAQHQYWRSVLAKLPKKARVLDLATGDGAVLKIIGDVRPDLKLVGVDYASNLPKIKAPIKLRSNISMENLPFGAGTIDAIVSRFGVEYGDIREIGDEVHRALRVEGLFAFIIHHKNSAIHSTNKSRLEGLDWALNKARVVERAIGYLNARGQLNNQVPVSFDHAVQSAISQFGQASVATEFTYAVRETLQIGWGKPTAVCVDIVQQLNRHANAEMRRITSMVAASKDLKGISSLAAELSRSGLEVEQPGILQIENQDAPIAWLLSGCKS